MNLENEARGSSDKAADARRDTHTGSKITYTREFLLSLSELECCKKLPSGFDQSLLSEFEDTSHGIGDRLRTHGSLPLQGFRRTEYGSSPPTRGDSGNYSRATYGRWDSRSSGRSDRDSDSQSDRESDAGKRHGSQSRKSWQGTEHDGLLGSGSFPRPSGYSAGMSAPKVRSNDQYQLNRSSEPYHPPRPYKAAPLSRRDTDSYNDETFGSTDEYTSDDRAEEERRRRASFELMRKEQHRALQEKQKSNLEKHNVDSVSDVSQLLDDVKEDKVVLNRDAEFDSNSNQTSTDTGKSASHSQAPCRPLVPPGFKSSIVDKTSGLKSSFQQSHSVENGILSSLDRKSSEVSLNGEPPEDKSTHMSVVNKDEQSASSSLGSSVPSKKPLVEDLPHQTSILPEALKISNEPEFVKLDTKGSGLKLGGELNENDATSILDKIFSNATAANASMDPVENHDNKAVDSWSQTLPSSKFARWFVEEERKIDERSSRPNDLLSLIVGSDKGGNHVDIQPMLHFSPEFPDQRSEIANMPTPNTSSTTIGVSESLPNGKSQEVVPAILTCEDLEQTILSEYGEKGQNSLEGLNNSDARSERPRTHVDNHASQHLLSLLQKGANQIDTIHKVTANTDPLELPLASPVFEEHAATYTTGQEVSKTIQTPGETLTLETLFGTAFMKELKSVEAPVSVHRGSVGSSQAETLEPPGLSFPVTENGLFPSNIDPVELEKITNEKNVLPPNHIQQLNPEKTEKWLGYDDPQIELNLPQSQAGVIPKHVAFDGSVEYHLPEEESLIAVNEDLNAQISRLIPGRNLSKKDSSASSMPGDIVEKLAALATVKDERATAVSDGPPFLPGSYEHEIAYRELHGQTPSSHFHSLQMGHGRPLLHPLDSHPGLVNSQMKFVGRESMIQHEGPAANQQFPGNMLRPPFSQPSVGASGFDLPGHHQMLQQMPMPGSFSPHIVNDFQRGAPVPHIGNQTSGFMQEINSVQGYPFGSRHPNARGVGMPLPGPNIHSGNNHPEAFQRLVEMELRAKSKQIPPPFGGHTPPAAIYGHELDMGFRYG